MGLLWIIFFGFICFVLNPFIGFFYIGLVILTSIFQD